MKTLWISNHKLSLFVMCLKIHISSVEYHILLKGAYLFPLYHISMYLPILLFLTIPVNLPEIICCTFWNSSFIKFQILLCNNHIMFTIFHSFHAEADLNNTTYRRFEGPFQRKAFCLVRTWEKVNGAKFLASINWQISPIMCHWSNLMWVANPPEKNNQHFSSHRGQCKSHSLSGNTPKCPIGLYTSNL